MKYINSKISLLVVLSLLLSIVLSSVSMGAVDPCINCDSNVLCSNAPSSCVSNGCCIKSGPATEGYHETVWGNVWEPIRDKLTVLYMNADTGFILDALNTDVMFYTRSSYGALDPDDFVITTTGANSDIRLNAGGGDVSIGSTAPRATLDVVGNLASLFVGIASDINNPQIEVSDEGNYGRLQSYNGILSINPLGNRVGVGTTDPREKLHVNGSLLVIDDGTFNGGDLTVNSSTNPGRTLRMRSTNVQYIEPSNDLYVQYPSSIIYRDSDNNRDVLRIEDNGDVGIKGSLSINSTTNPGRVLQMRSTTDQIIEPSNNLYIDYSDSIIFRDEDVGDRHTFRINDNGNVGVNTSNPVRTLDVNGNIRATREIETSTNVQATGDLIGTDILASGTVTIGSSSSDDITLGTLRWNSSNKAIEVLTATNTWSSLAKSSDIPSQNSNLWSDCSGSICNIDKKPVKITGDLKLEPTNVENKYVYKVVGVVPYLSDGCVASSSSTPAQDVCSGSSSVPRMSCDTSWSSIDCVSEVPASSSDPNIIKYDYFASISPDDEDCVQGDYVICDAMKYEKQFMSTVTGGDLDIKGKLSVNGISGFDLSFYSLGAHWQDTFYKELDKHAFCFLQMVHFSGHDSTGGDLTGAICDVYPTKMHSDGDYDWELKAAFEHGKVVECKSICVD